MRKGLIIVLSILYFNIIHAQTDTLLKPAPKVGLALSGGGAKGLAHIGILRIIDSLGIKVDYITGTSMGGILGGLYAMGYSADSIKQFALGLDWDKVLTNKVPLNEINIEEKDEYGNYIIDFPVEDGKPILPRSLVDGQYMSEVLSRLTFKARHINDFSKLPVPVQLTSSDIVNGGLIMQKSGSLPLAMRATLAIPAAFAPVFIDGKLLVDGGLDRNFPVQEVKAMGADRIIAGYTGFRLFTDKEIENPMKLIYQTHAFKSLEDSRRQMKMTDALVDYTKALFNHTTKDFKKYKQIIAIGETEANKYVSKFVQIAKEQRAAGVASNHKMVTEVNLPTIRIRVLNENGTQVPGKEEEMVLNLLNLKTNVVHSEPQISAAIKRVYGTRYFDKVYYTFTNNDSSALILNVFLKRGTKGRFNAAVHYDTEQSAGVILNYTYRNLFLSKSRLVVTVDLAERLKARLNYFKFLDAKNRLWVKPAIEYWNLKSNDITFRSITTNKTFAESDYFNSNLSTSLTLGYSPASSMAVEAGTEYLVDKFRKKLGSSSIFLLPELSDSKHLYRHNSTTFFARFRQNSLNDEYFTKSGNKLTAELKYFANNKLDLKQPDVNDAIGRDLYYYMNPDSIGNGSPGNVARFTLNEKFVQPVSKKISVGVNLFYGVNTSSRFGSSSTQYLFLAQKFAMGGYEARARAENPVFAGLRQREFPVNNFTSATLSLQYNPVRKIFITPLFSYGIINESWNPFTSNSLSDNIIGYGLDVGYQSLLGPVRVNVSKSNLGQPWHVYFTLGYKF